MLRLALPCLTLTSICLVGSDIFAVPPPPRELWTLREDAGRGFRGPFERLAMEPGEAIVRVATPAALYTVREGRVPPDARRRPSRRSRLLLAPGGEVLAWLSPHPTERGRLRAQLGNVQGGGLTELVLQQKPLGFSTLHLGYQGELRLTEELIPGSDSYEPGSRFTFWNDKGNPVRRVDVPRRPQVIPSNGSAVMLLQEDKAVAYRANREQLWERAGRFRNGVLNGDGTIALLNPRDQDETDDAYICRPGNPPVAIRFPTPVAGLPSRNPSPSRWG